MYWIVSALVLMMVSWILPLIDPYNDLSFIQVGSVIIRGVGLVLLGVGLSRLCV